LEALILAGFITFSLFLTIVASVNSAAEQELFYDDGEMDWAESCGGTAGYAVKFTPPTSPLVIDKVMIYGCYEPASAANNYFWVDIWDSGLNVMYEGEYEYKCFRYRGLGGFDWAIIDIPDIVVSGEFYVAFFPCMKPGQAYLWMGMDFDPPISNRSYFTDRELKYLQDPSERVSPPREWMIRVISSSSQQSPLPPSSPQQPVNIAEKAAVYVISQAISEYGGYKWLIYDTSGSWERPPEVAKIGIFFASLYQATGKSIYLDYAKGAAQWIVKKAVSECGGYKWACPDRDKPSPGWWLNTAVWEVGEFLLMMYKLTGNNTYLVYAKGAAQWMIAMAESEAAGYFIPYNPPGKTGSQAAHGIMPGREALVATFLLHMYQETGNSTYLLYAKETAEWLMTSPDIRSESGGYTWIHNRPYGSAYVVAGSFNPGGTAGVANFFYEIYQVTHNTTYLHYANGAIQWILSKAVFVTENSVKWPQNIGRSDYSIIMGLPPFTNYVTMSDLLLYAYSITGNSTYLEYARKHLNWIISEAISSSSGYVWRNNENAYATSMIYWSLCNAFQTIKGNTYAEYATQALNWIINNATSTDGGCKWKIVTYSPYYSWWFMYGASGIGYYLTQASGQQIPPPTTYNLHVQSYPITGIEITYSGDYSGIGTTNFDIGPKNSPFTVTLTAPSTYQEYTFDHWELDGVNVGQSNSLRVEVNEQNSVRVAKAVYKRPGYFVRLLFGDLEVENGSVLHVYFQTLKSEHAGSEVPINGVHIDWKTSFGINHTVSKTYNGVDGVIHLTYNLSSYSKNTFTIEMLPAQYDGFNVSPPSVNPLVLSLKPKQSMLVFGTELDFGASFEVDAEGRYYPYFLLANDGLEIHSAGFSETSKMGFGVDYHLLKAEIGTINGEVGGCAHVGISSGLEYELNDVTINNQKTLLKYLVTKWILKNVRCVTPEVLRFLVDGLLAIVNAKLSQNGLENYRSLTKLGSYGYASLGAEVYVGLSSTKGSAKNKITKLLYGGITGDVEVDAGLNIYSLTRVGFLGELSFDGKIEAGAGLDMGFLNITAKTGLLSFSARAGVELIFDGFEPHALKFTFTMGVPADKSDIISFGGLLKPLNEKAVREGLKNGGKIKFTMSIPASKLTAELLEYLKKLPRGEIVFDELLMNLMKSIANTPIQYEIIVAENPIIIPIGIELKLGGIGVEFKWTYNEFPEHVVEKGIIYNWHCWPLTEYYSPPKSISTLQFIKDWYVQELFGTVVQLKEKGKHLYLHVYDSLGRHVGINYETSQIEIQIPDSYYFDNMNGTTFIVLPTNLTEFKIVVDGKFAQEPTENYTLTLMTFTENRANYTETFSTIKNGEKQEYQAIIPNTGTPTITQIITKPWWIQHQLWIVSGVIGTVAILTVSVALIRRRKSVPPTTN